MDFFYFCFIFLEYIVQYNDVCVFHPNFAPKLRHLNPYLFSEMLWYLEDFDEFKWADFLTFINWCLCNF